MSTKTTAKRSTDAKPAAVKNGKTTIVNKAGKVTGVTVTELDEPTKENQGSNVENVNVEETTNKKQKENIGSKVATKKATKTAKDDAKKADQKKPISKVASATDRKIKLAATCYHYYRNWLKEFLRSRVSSARFQKAPESYDGHITVLESEKAKGLKALEQWNKENPDTKELFWDVKK